MNKAEFISILVLREKYDELPVSVGDTDDISILVLREKYDCQCSIGCKIYGHFNPRTS